MYGMSANGKGHTRNFMALAPPAAHRNDLLWELYTADISTLGLVVKAVHVRLIDSIGKHLLHTKHVLYSSEALYLPGFGGDGLDKHWHLLVSAFGV